MNDYTKKLINEMRRKELQWNSEKAIYHQKMDQLQTKCKSLQERLDSQHKACRILIDSIRQINENDSVAQLNKIECQLDDIKNFNSSQRQVIKKYIQDLMILVQRQNTFQIEKDKTKILTVNSYQSQYDESYIQNTCKQDIKENDMNVFQMICWNCQKVFDSKTEMMKAQEFFGQKDQFKKKNKIEKVDLNSNNNSLKSDNLANNLNEDLSPTKQQRSYSIHSIDEESQNSKEDDNNSIKIDKSNFEQIQEVDQKSQIQNEQVETDSFVQSQSKIDFLKTSSKKNFQTEDNENLQQNFHHKRVNSDSVFLPKLVQQNIQKNKIQEQDISTPQFDLQKQTNIQDNKNYKSNRNLMEQFVSEMYNSNNQQDNFQQKIEQSQNTDTTKQDIFTEQTIQENQQDQSELHNSNIASLRKNLNKTQNNKVISFSNIDQIQQVIENEKKVQIKASIEEIAENQEDNQQDKLNIKEEIKQENQEDLKQSEYPFFNQKNFHQELFGKKESLSSSAQLKTLLSQTSRNYSNAKQQKKFDRQITKDFEKESFIETKSNGNLKRLSHSSEFEQNKISQNLFKQGSNITRHKVNKKFEFQHKKSEGNVPNFNNSQNVLKRIETEDLDYFDVKLDYEIIQKNLNLFQSPEKEHKRQQEEIQASEVIQNKYNNNEFRSPQENKVQKNMQIDYLKRKNSQTEKRENSIKFENILTGKNFKQTSREKLKKRTSQEKKIIQQPYVQYKSSFQIPRFSCKKSFKENQKILTLQKSSFDKLIPQRLQHSKYDNKYSPKYKSFYKKPKAKKTQGSFKRKYNKKEENFNIEIINTELIKIPTTVKRVTLKRIKSRDVSPTNRNKKKQPKDSLKELQSALNEKFYEINSKIYQLKFNQLIMKILFLFLIFEATLHCPGIRYCRQCSIFEETQICSNCESTVYNLHTKKCEQPTYTTSNCIRYNNDPNNSCLECEEGYRLTKKGTCEQCTVNNCAVCSTDSQICESCFKGLAVEGNLCESKQCDLSYCEICDSAQATCLKCQDHYSLNNSYCQPGLDNCLQLKKSDNQKCEICNIGYFLNEEYFCQINETKSYKIYFLIFFFFVVVLFVSMLLYHRVLRREHPDETYISIETQLSYNKQK